MASIDLEYMKAYLSKSISSMNRNKIYGLLAEVDFRNYLEEIGFGEKVSIGGWIARNEGAGTFGHNTIAFFPGIIKPDQDYSRDRELSRPAHGLHTICATFHQLGIYSYFCFPKIDIENEEPRVEWYSVQLGLPTEQEYKNFPDNISGFNRRERNYNFLRYNSDVSGIPSESIPEEFSKEHLRVSFQNNYMNELSDIDGILWGNQYTYPIEIKEKTPADSPRLGKYFGLDIGPFVKLAFYAAKKGNLHSIFVVREIDNTETRNLVKWWYITFDNLAQFASWNFQGGGRNMQGGLSSVVKIPYAEFRELNKEALEEL